MGKPLSTTQRRENFERLVHEAESLIRSHPKRYRAKLAALAVLGYGVIFGLLGLLIALSFGCVWLIIISHSAILFLLKSKLIIALPVLIWVILKSLWVHIPAPVGYELKRKDFPALFADIDNLCHQLNTAKIEQVLLTDEFNAAITQTPRLGVFGWHKNSLILGLPLLLGLSPEQARAALAHELGHLSGNHSRFNAWIYRVRKTWYQVSWAFEQSNAPLVGKFFNWYAPYFNAYSFALARANEYEADAISAKMTNEDALAQCLIAVSTYGNLLNQYYWQPFIDPSNHKEITEQSPYGELAQFFCQPTISEAVIRENIHRAYTLSTHHDDTHPSTKDRLAALHKSPEILAPLEKSAAQVWFGNAYQQVLTDFDQEWMCRNGLDVKERGLQRQKLLAELAELQAHHPNDLNQAQQVRIADLVTHLQGSLKGMELYKTYLAQYPDDLEAHCYLGQLKLQNHDETGMEHLLLAMQQFSLVLAVCEAAYHYYETLGDKAECLRWRERGEAQLDLQTQAYHERNQVFSHDRLVPCELSEEVQEHLRQQLLQIKNLKHVWICKKHLEIAPEESPVNVLAYQATGWFPDEKKLTKNIIDGVGFEITTFLVMKGGAAKAVASQVMQKGTQLF
jgi:Zn-dependent protease with chaperone function